MPSGKPGARVLQKIICVGDEVGHDEELQVGSDLSPASREASDSSITIYSLSRDDLRGDVFEDRRAVPIARRWVPHDRRVKTKCRELAACATSIDLVAPLPPLPAGVAVDNRKLRIFAKFGSTELSVRMEVLVDGIVKPEFSREIPIVYPA